MGLLRHTVEITLCQFETRSDTTIELSYGDKERLFKIRSIERERNVYIFNELPPMLEKV